MKMKDTLDALEPEKKTKKKKKLKKEGAKKKSSNKKKSESTNKKTISHVTKADAKSKKPYSPATQSTPNPLENTPASYQDTPAPERVSLPKENTKPAETANLIASAASDVSRNRVSKNLQVPLPHQQAAAIERITRELVLGDISQGLALRELRVKVLGLRQETFANQVGVSRKTLSEIENNKGNYTSEVINKVFKPFELQVGLLPINTRLLKTLVAE